MTGYTKTDNFNEIFDKEVKKYEENIAKDKFVVYPDPQFTMEELIQHKQMSDEKQDDVIFTPKVEEEGRIDEFPNIKEIDAEDKIIEVTPDVRSVIPPEELKKISEKIKAEVESEAEIEDKLMEGVEKLDDSEDLNKKTYAKITPTLYIKLTGTEKNKEGEEIKLYKVLNPETGVVEKRQLTDGEKHEIHVHGLKESHIKFHPIKNAVKTVGITTVVSPIGRKRQIKDKTTLTNITTNQFGSAYKKKRRRKNQLQKASRKANR